MKDEKKGIMLNVYFNEHWDRNIFFSFFLSRYESIFSFLLYYLNVHLFISPTFFNHQGEIVFVQEFMLPYYTQLHVLFA